MIVTCEGCKARFKFDETRIKPQGIKVHCSKCRHTFVLKPAARTGDPPVIRTGPPEKPQAPPADASAAAPADAVSPEPAAQAEEADDPLADVPGFEPVTPPPPSPEDEEKKALAGLRKDEILDASVGDALGRFQVPEGVVSAETADVSEAGDAAETAGDDKTAGTGKAAEHAGSGPGFDNFDWDQVSFTDNTDAAEAAGKADDAGGAETPAEDAASDAPEIVGIDGDFIADDGEQAPAEGEKKPAPAEARRGPPLPGEGDGKDLELDLSNMAPKREVTLAGAKQAPKSEPPAAAPAVSRGPQERVSAKVRTTRPLVQAFRTRTGQPRPRLALPGFPTLVASAVLAVVAAAAGALLVYGPFTGNAFEARPAGAANGSTVLEIEDARGVMVEPLGGHARYVVTGTAHWESAPGAAYVLEGVITGPEGDVLQRRPARLGATPDWKVIEEVDPDLFAAKESVPGEGEIPFTVLFTPEPSWQGEVHFELSASP